MSFFFIFLIFFAKLSFSFKNITDIVHANVFLLPRNETIYIFALFYFFLYYSYAKFFSLPFHDLNGQPNDVSILCLFKKYTYTTLSMLLWSFVFIFVNCIAYLRLFKSMGCALSWIWKNRCLLDIFYFLFYLKEGIIVKILICHFFFRQYMYYLVWKTTKKHYKYTFYPFWNGYVIVKF